MQHNIILFITRLSNDSKDKIRNFKVKIVKLARKDAKKDNIWGYYDTDKSIIAIQEDIKNITLLDTLLHEIAHMIAHKSEIV